MIAKCSAFILTTKQTFVLKDRHDAIDKIIKRFWKKSGRNDESVSCAGGHDLCQFIGDVLGRPDKPRTHDAASVDPPRIRDTYGFTSCYAFKRGSIPLTAPRLDRFDIRINRTV